MKKTSTPRQQNRDRRGLHAIYIAAAAYLILHLVSPFLDPPHLFWGVRFFPWLDGGLLVIPAVALGLVTWLYLRPRSVEKSRTLSPRIAFVLLAGVCFGAVLVANIDAFVLGDGENVLFQIVNPGEQKLVREPLVLAATKGLKDVAKALYPPPDLRNVMVNASHSPGSFTSIIHAEHALTLLGIACLVLALSACRRLLSDWFHDGSGTLSAGLFLLGSGFLALYAGYAEYYAAAISLSILLHAFLLRSLREKSYSWAAAATYGIACTAYVGMAVYLPAFLLSVYYARGRSIRQLALHLLVTAAVLTGIFLAIGYSPVTLWTYFAGSAESSSSHIIPFGGPHTIKHAYTAFSPYHFLDLANLFLLVNPIAVVVASVGIVGLIRGRYGMETTDAVLLTSIGCSLAMMFLVNCDIGMVADWDLVAPFMVPFIVYALWVIARRIHAGIRKELLLTGTIAVLAHSTLWMWTLADDDASIKRLAAMQNRETFSFDGLHYTTMNLMRYYGRTGQTERGLVVMQRLIDTVLPDDPRGYFTLAQMYFDRNLHDRSFDVLRRSIDRGIADYRIESQYAKMLREQGDIAGAIRHYRAYMTKLPPGFSDSADVSVKILYLGVCYAQTDSTQRAIETMHDALRWNPSNAYASLTLAQLYLRTDRKTEALPLIRAVAAMPREPALQRYADSLLRVIGDPASALREAR